MNPLYEPGERELGFTNTVSTWGVAPVPGVTVSQFPLENAMAPKLIEEPVLDETNRFWEALGPLPLCTLNVS